jgi:NAD-dependent deacetylase
VENVTSNLYSRAKRAIDSARRPVSFSGAGLSAASGIATFRGDDESLWSQYNPAELASEQGFNKHPQRVMDWYANRRRVLADAQPNAAHNALASQAHWTHITQNVDDLLERAGSPPSSVLHLHGSLLADRCLARCGHEDVIDLSHPPGLRDCPQCGSKLRPTVVWFGEQLPTDVWTSAMEAVTACDLLLVVGTRAEVHPAAGLIDVARESGASVLVINNDASVAVNDTELFLLGDATELLPHLLTRD